MAFEHTGEKIPTAPSKDPDSVLDYGCDWSQWLQAGEVITSSVWLLLEEVGGIVIDSDTFSDSETSAILSGGTVTKQYVLTNRITTSFGREEDRSMKISVKEK